MDLLPDEAQQEIIDQTAAYLAAELPLGRLHDLEEPGEQLADAAWRSIAELGWFGLGLPEGDGGVGFTLAEEALVLREIGRALGPPALLASVLGARVAARSGDSGLRDAILAGDARVAFGQGFGDPAPELGESVSGRFHVFDLERAQHVFVVGAQGAALLDAASARVVRTPRCIDETLALSEVALERAPARCFVAAEDEPMLERTVVLSAASLVGVAEAARDDAVAYAKERIQFGKPIGVFQAIKHPCADMAVACEAAWSQTVVAALALRDGAPDAAFQAAAAKLLAGTAAIRGAEADVQIHGGYGFTAEYAPHRFVKRAHVLDEFAGDAAAHCSALLEESKPTTEGE